MFGILSTLFAIEGLGLGAFLTGSGLNSWWNNHVASATEREDIRVKKLHKNWAILVKEAYLDKETGKYVGLVCCELTKKNVSLYCNSEKELREGIDDAVRELSETVDDYYRKKFRRK